MCTPQAEPRPITWARPTLASAIWRSPPSWRRCWHASQMLAIPAAEIGCPFDCRPPETLTGFDPSRHGQDLAGFLPGIGGQNRCGARVPVSSGHPGRVSRTSSTATNIALGVRNRYAQWSASLSQLNVTMGDVSPSNEPGDRPGRCQSASADGAPVIALNDSAAVFAALAEGIRGSAVGWSPAALRRLEDGLSVRYGTMLGSERAVKHLMALARQSDAA